MLQVSDWIKRVLRKPMIVAIASLGIWQTAMIASAQAQQNVTETLRNVVVYIAGNNPATLNVTRQVVTNPTVALINGQTSIVAGTFDAATADYVTRELQRRGVAAQQGYQSPSTLTPPSSSVNLPSYLPTTPVDPAMMGSSLSQYRYVTAVPLRGGASLTLAQVQRLIPNAFISKSGRGDYIYAGGYTNRDGAESLKHFLRSQGLDARVLYF